MEIAVTRFDGFQLVKLSGALDRNAAGPLYEAMVQCVGDGSAKTIVDLAGVDRLTPAGVGGLVVAAKLTQTGGGALWLCNADTEVEAQLRSLGHNHLFSFDRSVEAVIALLLAGAEQDAAPTETMPSATGPAGSVGLRSASSHAAANVDDGFREVLRLEYARFLVRSGQFPLARIAESCGYASAEAVHRAFLHHVGFPPADDARRVAAGAGGATTAKVAR